MKKSLIFSIILFGGFFLMSSTVLAQDAQKNKIIEQKKVQYTCTMHPEVIQDKPGNCPKCGMTLVEKKEKAKEGAIQSQDSKKSNHDHNKMNKDSSCTNEHKDTSNTKHGSCCR